MPLRLTKLLSLFLSFCLILEQSAFAQSIDLSHYFVHNPAQTISQSDKFRPLHLRYLGYDNLSQDFKLLLDKGDTRKEDLENKAYLEENTQTLLKYFFIGLSLPNDKFWVNLRPDAPDNIIDDDLAQTDVGKILLEVDLQLKKDTANWTSPQTPEGKEYWNKLYKKAGELFGTENIAIPTLTRPWIVPDEIILRESPDTSAYIYKATLKVMLEEDYLKALPVRQAGSNQQPATSNQIYSFSDPRLKELNQYSTQLIKETILPKLTQEINSSRRYAPLRQVYYSLILAQWFKARYANNDTPYTRLINQKDLTNLLSKESWSKNTYFKQYQKSFKEGEYNISQPVYTPSGQTIRSYFSGGISVMSNSPLVEELKRPIGATDNKAVLSAVASTALSGYLLPGAGQVDVFTQSLESEEDFGGTMGRWKYAYVTFDADGKLTLHNATRIPRKDGVVEEEFLIEGENKRDIVLQTRELNSTEQNKISAIRQELGIDTEPRVILRDESAIKHRIYDIAAQGIHFQSEIKLKLTSLKNKTIETVKIIARDGQADIRPVIELARQIYPSFNSYIPESQWSTITAEMFIILNSALKYQIYLPNNEIFEIVRISEEPDVLGGKIKEGSWHAQDYLKSKIWVAESLSAKEGYSVGGLTAGWLAVINADDFREVGKERYRDLKQSALRSRTGYTSPYEAVMIPLIHAAQVGEEDFVEGIFVEHVRQEEIRHAQDNSYVAQKLRRDNRFDSDEDEQTVSEILKSDSTLYQRVFAHLDQQAQADKLTARLNRQLSLRTITEYSARVGGAIAEMKKHTADGREELAFMAFLNFMEDQFLCVTPEQIPSDDIFKLAYLNVAVLLFQDIDEWAGVSLDRTSIDVIRMLGMESGKLPVKKALRMLEEIYAKHFWTDKERYARLSFEPFEPASSFLTDYTKRGSTAGITLQGIIFIREDIIAEGNQNQIKEALDHENRELTSKSHDEIRTQQFQGGLRRLIKILSDRDKINSGWSNMLSREPLPTITQQTELAPTIRANPPVAGSFLIADLKFTPEGKVKILEFGNGLNSGFVGYDALYDVDMRTLFWNHLVSSGLPIWFINENEELRPSVSRNIVRMSSWNEFKDAVEKGAWGQRKTNFDPNDHSTYSGIIVTSDPITYRIDEPLQDLLKRNPWLFPFSGGGATFKYAEDKFLTATLFSDDLQDYFPKWRVFPKEYRAGFAEEIISDMPSKKYVIKPLWIGDSLVSALTGIDTGATRGNGVLVVEAAQLDSTLRQIFGVDQRKEFERMRKEELRLPNPSKYPHEYWLFDQSPVFLIETFEEGKRIFVKGQNYDPTARIAFLLSYNKGEVSIDVLDGYYKLPPKSIDEAEGRDTRISKIVKGRESSAKISGEQKTAITQQLKSFLPQIYQKMISSDETTAIDSLLFSDRIEYIVYGIHLLRESKKVLPRQAERLKFLAGLHNKVLDLSLLDLIQRMYFFSQKQDIPIEFIEALIGSEVAEVRDGILELSLENNLTNISLSFQNHADQIQDQKLKSEYLVYLYKEGIIQKVVLFKGIESIFNENEIGAQQFILEYLVDNKYIFQVPWIFDYLKKDRSSLLFAHWGRLFNAQRHKLGNQADNNDAKAIIYEYDRIFSEMSPVEVAKLLRTIINEQDSGLIEWCWKFAQDLAARINDTKFNNLVREPEHLMAWAWGRSSTDVFRYLGDKVNQFLSKEDNKADRGSSPLIMPKIDSSLNTPGGIDFRTLPIVTQAISNLSMNASRIPLSKLDSINLNQEWIQIQKIAGSGITPSAERIKEYIQLSCLKGDLNDMQKIISCIADILRNEEERCVSTDPTLKDILVVLESGRSAQELRAVFTGNQS